MGIRKNLTVASLVAVSSGLAGLLVGDFLAYRRRAEVPPCNIYGENPEVKEDGCYPAYVDYKDVEYNIRRFRDDSKRHIISIQFKENVPLDNGETINPSFAVNYGLDDPQFNAMILALPPTNGRPICHFDNLPLPTHIKPDISVYPVGHFQNYIGTVDVDCDNRIETIRFWYERRSTNGSLGYDPLPASREGSDETIFRLVEIEHREWRQKMHVDEILAKVGSQEI